MSLEDNQSWILELEEALLDTEALSVSDIYAICKGRPLPKDLRPKVWQACLDISDRGNQFVNFDEIFDLPEQAIIHDDCELLVNKLGNEDEDKLSVLSDIESVITFYCKSRGKQYEKNNGWLDLLSPLISLNLPKSTLYNLFEAIRDNYIPRVEFYCSVLRLLLLYHDPELCSFLDTKHVSPDKYAKEWINTLFANVCSLTTISAMWDFYFMQSDPFFMMFISLVIIVNAKELLTAMKDKQTLIDSLSALPSALEVNDIADLCSLAQFYALKTPSSFKIDLYGVMFGDGENEKLITHALCLPVSAQELVENTIQTSTATNEFQETVRFFLVDCRPVEQYNAGHLPTAFHLDCNLMLQEPAAFATAVQGLLKAQKQALIAGSQAGGDHLCFLGSGRQEEDQYTLMVVASFLQKQTQYVSMVYNGYQGVHEYFGDEINSNLIDHNPQNCLICNSYVSEENLNKSSFLGNNSVLFGKISLAMKEKSQEMKGMFFDYIQNSNVSFEKNHNQGNDNKSKVISPMFSITDEHEQDAVSCQYETEETLEVVSLQQWLNDPSLINSFKCQEIKVNGCIYDSRLLVTPTHLVVLREDRNNKDLAHIVVKRPLSSIVRITSRKKHPNLITFKYGSTQSNDTIISDMDKFLIPNASEVTKLITKQILQQ